jgi:hypothetical protein
MSTAFVFGLVVHLLIFVVPPVVIRFRAARPLSKRRAFGIAAGLYVLFSVLLIMGEIYEQNDGLWVFFLAWASYGILRIGGSRMGAPKSDQTLDLAVSPTRTFSSMAINKLRPGKIDFVLAALGLGALVAAGAIQLWIPRGAARWASDCVARALYPPMCGVRVGQYYIGPMRTVALLLLCSGIVFLSVWTWHKWKREPRWPGRVREAVGARVGRLRVRKHLRRLHGGQLAVLCAAAGVLAVGAVGLLSRAEASSRTEFVARCLPGGRRLARGRPIPTVSSCTNRWEESSAGELFDTLFVLLTGTAAGVMLLLLVAIWIRLDTRNDSAVGTGID